MKHIRKFNEDFDPMQGIKSFLDNPVAVAIVTAWILSGKFFDDVEESSEKFINRFIEYCNHMGYQIDKEYLNHKFKEGVLKLRKILKSPNENTKLY